VGEAGGESSGAQLVRAKHKSGREQDALSREAVAFQPAQQTRTK